MATASSPTTLKLLFIGSSSVGKSSLLLRFTDDAFLGDEEATATIGVDYKVKMMEREGKRFKVTIWDTAGQERFRTLTSSYYRGAHGVVIVYDITQRDSFEALKMWLNELDTFASTNVVRCLVGNKCDREAQRAVPKEEGQRFADEQGCSFIETSAKTNDGVLSVFERVVDAIIARPELYEASSRRIAPGAFPGSSYVSLGEPSNKDGWGCSC